MDGQTTDLAWLAGFIDAEGWFGVMRRQRTYRSGVLNVRYRPAIQVGNTDEGTWPVVTTILDRWGLAYNEYMRTHNGVQWSVEVRGSLRCAAWIDVLLPYLRVKQADARLLREYCTFVLEHPNAGSAGRAYSAREQEILALFGVEPTMAVRPPLRTRSPLLAAG